MLKLCPLIAAIFDGGQGHPTYFWKFTNEGPSMQYFFFIGLLVWEENIF